MNEQTSLKYFFFPIQTSIVSVFRFTGILKTYLPEHAAANRNKVTNDSPADESLNLIDAKDSNDEDPKNVKSIFTDPKLESMWQEAQTESFSSQFYL